ncbi:MAG: MBL fold metallo-hydrolase [Bacteroidota bacterium]
MKKILKRIAIGFGILILILALCAGGFYLKIRSEIKDMNVTETKEVVSNVFAIKDGFVNMFVVKDSNQYIAIDAGNDTEVIKAELAKLSIDPNKVAAVLLTHSDGDHVAALKLFKNAKIYLSKEEVHMINGDKSKFLWFGNNIHTKDYATLDDQQILTINNTKVQCILTQGHTSGSMCYLINDKYLFIGDAMSLKDGKLGKPNEFFTVDNKAAEKSISKVTALPDAEYIFTAHYGYTNNYKAAVKDWGK